MLVFLLHILFLTSSFTNDQIELIKNKNSNNKINKKFEMRVAVTIANLLSQNTLLFKETMMTIFKIEFDLLKKKDCT
jgi:hypothetical protein